MYLVERVKVVWVMLLVKPPDREYGMMFLELRNRFFSVAASILSDML